jgi:gas vesicle protein
LLAALPGGEKKQISISAGGLAMSDNRLSRSILGFCVGMGLGAVLGLIFAPKSGEELRGDISEGAQQGLNAATRHGRKWARRAKGAASDVSSRVSDVTSRVSDQLDEAMDSGREAYEEARAKAARASHS